MRVNGFVVHGAACLAVTVAGATAVVVGSGGAGGVVLAGPQVLRLVRDAPAALASYPAVDVRGRFTFSGNGRSVTENFSVLGSSDQKTGIASIDLPGESPLSMRIADGKIYTAVPAAERPFFGGHAWLACATPAGGHTSAAPSSDAFAFLKLMPGATGDVRVIGHDVIGGVKTTHYRMTLDLVKAAQAEAAQAQTASGTTVTPDQIRQLQGAGVTTTPLDVWVDAQRALRQFQIKATFQGLTMNLKMDVTGSSQAPTVTSPPAADTLDSEPCSFMFQQLASHLHG